MTRVLVTGAAGFIGSGFVDLLLAERPDIVAVTGVDKLGYAGDIQNLAHALTDDRFRFIEGDIRDTGLTATLVREADEVAHFAAESMVDRSVRDPQSFLDVNVLGTGSVLEAARDARVRRFLHISTPEVYGQRVETAARESDAFAPRNVYAASKAAAEMVVSAYVHSFRVPILITRGSSAIGPRQHPEKVAPRLITSALQNQSLPVYGDGSAMRDFVHVSDLNRANDLVLRRGEVGTAYNVATGEARTIRDLAYGIVDRLGKPRSLVAFTDDRVAHDRHYLMDSSRLTSLGWSPQYTFEPALDDTVRWYMDHRAWWLAKVESPDFQRYLSRSAEARAWHATRSGA